MIGHLGELYLEAQQIEEYPKKKELNITFAEHLLNIANVIDLEYSLVASVVLIVLAKELGKHLTLNIQSECFVEDNIGDQIRTILALFDWNLEYLKPKIRTSKIINKCVQEGHYFMKLMEGKANCLTLGKKDSNITINSMMDSDLSVKLKPVPLLAEPANMKFQLPAMKRITDSFVFTDEPVLLRVVSEVCASTQGQSKVSYAHISEASRILSNMDIDPQVLLTPKTTSEQTPRL